MNKTLGFTSKQISDAYDETYSNSDHLRDTDALYRWILKKISPLPGRRLLDVACGLGLLVYYARKRDLEVFGIDLSYKAIQLALSSYSRNGLSISNGEYLPFSDASFDYITNIGSLEHFTSMEKGLQEMRRVLKTDGKVAIFVPNSYYLIDILWKVWRTGYSISHRQIIERFATYNEWKDFLENNGLIIENGYKYNHLFPIQLTDWKWHLKHPKRIIVAMTSPFIPKNLSYHFLFICRKAN
jgi:ubiquinone/menaquinone biosynthesis C-methylase UbiE